MSRGQGPLHDARIAFIGSGTMAEAMIKALLARGVVSTTQIMASHPTDDRCTYLRSAYGVHTTRDNVQAAQDASIVVLSVKPQVLRSVMTGLRGKIPPHALLLSIVAGARIQTLRRGCDHACVVRTMPNMPAQVGLAVTVWTATPEVTREQRAQAQAVLRALGEDIAVSNEHDIDMATALSGAGPAFVFLFIEAMIDAGVQLGFSRADARNLTVQTFLGAAELVRQSQEHPAVLRDKVTSPGGATAAGLYALNKSGVRTAISDAIQAVFRRTQELAALSERADG